MRIDSRSMREYNAAITVGKRNKRNGGGENDCLDKLGGEMKRTIEVRDCCLIKDNDQVPDDRDVGEARYEAREPLEKEGRKEDEFT